ncbi:hypothetical protein TRVL_03014 [Trypanosoma vivax]|nr:hypothetical protein TRVL_03014 [Trypanosoma vivax]
MLYSFCGAAPLHAASLTALAATHFTRAKNIRLFDYTPLAHASARQNQTIAPCLSPSYPSFTNKPAKPVLSCLGPPEISACPLARCVPLLHGSVPFALPGPRVSLLHAQFQVSRPVGRLLCQAYCQRHPLPDTLARRPCLSFPMPTVRLSF